MCVIMKCNAVARDGLSYTTVNMLHVVNSPATTNKQLLENDSYYSKKYVSEYCKEFVLRYEEQV